MKFTEKLLSKNSYNKDKITAASIGALGGEAAANIARDGEYTCFVEVRMRKNNNFGTPADTIDERKRRRIINTAMCYAKYKGIYDTTMRFDAVLINATSYGTKLSDINAEVIKDAFRL